MEHNPPDLAHLVSEWLLKKHPYFHTQKDAHIESTYINCGCNSHVGVIYHNRVVLFGYPDFPASDPEMFVKLDKVLNNIEDHICR